MSKKGLYYSDLRESEGVVLINTVEYNKSKYSVADYKRTVDARKLQNILGGPSFNHFCRIMKKNKLRNCPVTIEDVDAAEDIFTGTKR